MARSAQPGEPLLRLAGVHTHIGAYHILHGVDFEVPAGQVDDAARPQRRRQDDDAAHDHGPVGGVAGHGHVRRSPDRRSRHGRRCAARGQRGTPEIAQLGIAYVPENMGIFADLTVSENMLLAARARAHGRALDAKRLEWLFGLFPALKKFWLYPAGKLSGGQKQMLAIARAMVEPRRLLLIDEPSKGLAPAIVQNLIAALRELKRTETTILLVEQNFAMAKALGDRVAVMDDGRVVHRGADGRAGRRTRRCSTACSASRWRRTSERRPASPHDDARDPARQPRRSRRAASTAVRSR